MRLFRQGLSIEEVAGRRGLTRRTIVSHLEFLATDGEQLDLDRHLPPAENTEKIVAAFRELGNLYTALKPVKEMVGEDCSYEEIRLVRIFLRQQGSLASTDDDPGHEGAALVDPESQDDRPER